MSLVPKSRNVGRAPPGPCSDVGRSRRLPREARLGAPPIPAHSNKVCRARFCRKKNRPGPIPADMPAPYWQNSSPGRARGLSSLSPAYLLLRLQNTLEALRSCHFPPKAPQTDTCSRRYEDSSSDLRDTAVALFESHDTRRETRGEALAGAVSVDICVCGGGGKGEFVFLMMTFIEDVFSPHPIPTCMVPYCTRNTPRPKFNLQPFSQKSRTPPVAKEFQIGVCGVVQADLELFCNCWSAGFLGERLYVWPSSASAILCPPTERQQPHGDDKGVMEIPAGNRIDEARARRDPPRFAFLTAADPFGSTAPLTEPAQASENWVATRRLHDSRLRRAADPLASEAALAGATEASEIWVATQFSTDHWISNTSLWSFRNDRVMLRPRRAGLTGG